MLSSLAADHAGCLQRGVCKRRALAKGDVTPNIWPGEGFHKAAHGASRHPRPKFRSPPRSCNHPPNHTRSRACPPPPFSGSQVPAPAPPTLRPTPPALLGTSTLSVARISNRACCLLIHWLRVCVGSTAHLQGGERAKGRADPADGRRLQRVGRQARAALEEAGGGAVRGRGRALRVAAAARLDSGARLGSGAGAPTQTPP